MIKELPTHIDLKQICDHWLKIALSTDPINHAQAEAAIDRIYRDAKFKLPKKIWLDSPLQAILEVIKRVPDFYDAYTIQRRIDDTIWYRVDNNVWSYLFANVDSDLLKQVNEEVQRSVEIQSWRMVGTFLWNEIYFHPSKIIHKHTIRFHNKSISSIAFKAVFLDLVPGVQLMRGFIDAAQFASCWTVLDNFVLFCERPIQLHRDLQGRLHHETGPAAIFPDGFSVYAWHGVRVPLNVIEDPTTITLKQIEESHNSEIHRVLIERYGVERYLLDSKTKLIHKDDWGILYFKELRDDEPITVVKVEDATPEPDGTRKTYFLRVPPQITTAREAVAWSFSLREDQYKKLQRQS